MEKLKFGVIGCAGIARKAFIPAVKKSEFAEVTIVSSLLYDEAKEVAAQFECKAVESYEDVVNCDDIDAVYIAVPNGLHADFTIASANAGKHVLCEKSLAVNTNEVNNIIQACKKNNVALLEGFAYQFHPQHKQLREMVNSGRIGEPVLFQGWFGFPPIKSSHRYDKNLGGGAVLDAGAYPIHSARKFFKREPITAKACVHNGNETVEIHGSVLLDFGMGQTALLAFGFDNMYRNSYSVWGTSGVITLTRAYSIPPTFSPTLILEQQGCREEHILKPFDPFLGEIEWFCQNVDNHDILEMWRQDASCQANVIEDIKRQ